MSEHAGIGLSSSRRGVPHRAKYKKPIEWKALNERAHRRSDSMLLIVDEHNKQNKAGTTVTGKQVQQLGGGKALEGSFVKSSSRQVPLR